MNAFNFLISTLFDLYIMLVLLRVWLQWARADFYNPFSQFVVKATQPVVAPLRRIIPSLGGLDMATLLFAYLLSVAKLFILDTIAINAPGLAIVTQVANELGSYSIALLIVGLISTIKAAGSMIFWVLILRAILSWVSQGQNPIEYVIIQLTEPLLSPIRRVIPPMGGLDLSVLFLFIGMQFLNYVIGDFLTAYGIPWFGF